LLPQRSKHPQEMVITPKASTSSFGKYDDATNLAIIFISIFMHVVPM